MPISLSPTVRQFVRRTLRQLGLHLPDQLYFGTHPEAQILEDFAVDGVDIDDRDCFGRSAWVSHFF